MSLTSSPFLPKLIVESCRFLMMTINSTDTFWIQFKGTRYSSKHVILSNSLIFPLRNRFPLCIAYVPFISTPDTTTKTATASTRMTLMLIVWSPNERCFDESHSIYSYFGYCCEQIINFNLTNNGSYFNFFALWTHSCRKYFGTETISLI